jgi:Flp pilus assembly protein TadB
VDVAVSTTTKIVHDMTPVAAQAQIETARLTHAVPAQEETAREVQHTQQIKHVSSQQTIRHCVVAAVILVGVVMMGIKPDAAIQMAASLAVLGGVYGLSLWKRDEKSPPPSALTDGKGAQPQPGQLPKPKP